MSAPPATPNEHGFAVESVLVEALATGPAVCVMAYR